jgi:hypothetical protein
LKSDFVASCSNFVARITPPYGGLATWFSCCQCSYILLELYDQQTFQGIKNHTKIAVFGNSNMS